MDSNKDEAERCLDRAERYLDAKRFEDAEKFIKKAQRLYPTQRAQELMTKLSSPDMRNNAQSQPEVRKRTKCPTDNGIKAQTTIEYTEEQIEHVRRIKKCKDYYEILAVTKEATDNDIKKAYKKLALQLHPDKNKAPGAAEAFKAIGNAVAVLTDPDKRKQYDMFGSDEERVSTRHSHANHTYSYTRGFEADITAEELFNMFFGGFPQQEFYVRRGNTRWMRQNQSHTQNTHSQQANGYTTFLQMLPVLLLIVLTMMSSFFISDPVYNLHHSSKYPVQRVTQNLKVPYFVKENFHVDYDDNLRRLETSIEEDFMTYLKHACYRERNYRESMVWRAMNFGDQEQIIRARNIETPSCKKYQDIQQKGGI